MLQGIPTDATKVKMRSVMGQFFRLWSFFSLYVVVVFFGWIFIHELSHSIVCEAISGDAGLFNLIPNPGIRCSGISDESGLLVPKFAYFIMIIIPYLISIALSLYLSFQKKHYSIAGFFAGWMLFFDAIYNLSLSGAGFTDFSHSLFLGRVYFFIALLIGVCAAYFAGMLIVSKWSRFKVEFKTYVEGFR